MSKEIKLIFNKIVNFQLHLHFYEDCLLGGRGLDALTSGNLPCKSACVLTFHLQEELVFYYATLATHERLLRGLSFIFCSLFSGSPNFLGNTRYDEYKCFLPHFPCPLSSKRNFKTQLFPFKDNEN